MRIIIHSTTNANNIGSNYGAAEYSYYFVLKEFLPVLKKLGEVIIIEDPATEVDVLYEQSQRQRQLCIFLSFSPPHKTNYSLKCPTVPLLAWEFEDIPFEMWSRKPENDWRFVLGKLGYAITHSSHTATRIRRVMRGNYPVTAIAAPVWDRFQHYYEPRYDVKNNQLNMIFEGIVVDSADKIDSDYFDKIEHFVKKKTHSIHIKGTLYTTVLNPLDGRKNWQDMITAFCYSLNQRADATLLLKFTNKHTAVWLKELLTLLGELPAHKCRVLMLNGFIDDSGYEELTRKTTYTVNASKGEGQCLPLMEYMSAGKPAISPRHTGMEDYINKDNAFIVDSSTEPSCWPEDARGLYRTYYYRICWDSLRRNFSDSYELANNNSRDYQRMSKVAHKQLKDHCSQKVVYRRLKLFLNNWKKITKIERSF